MLSGKIETSKANAKLVYSTIISVPYCALQHLLRYEEPIAYTTSLYGWDADVYDFGDDFKGTEKEKEYGQVCICTGYRPFGDVESCAELNALYDKIAQYFYNTTAPEKRKEVLHALTVAWITVTLLHNEAVKVKEN